MQHFVYFTALPKQKIKNSIQESKHSCKDGIELDHDAVLLRHEEDSITKQNGCLGLVAGLATSAASWSDVSHVSIIAAEFANNLTLTQPVPVKKSVKKFKAIESGAIISIALEEEDAVISELDNLYTCYTRLFIRTREHIEKLVETNELSVQKIVSILRKLISIKECKLITELFDILRECNHFLDGSILQIVIALSIGNSDLLQEIIEHNEKVKRFKMTQPIEILKQNLWDCDTADHCRTVIKLKQSWGEIHIHLVEQLIKTLLQLKGDIEWISVISP